MQNFEINLKSLRLNKNLTQKQLALETQLSERGIQNYESGLRKPTYEILLNLADYFDVPIDFLAGRGVFENWDIIIENWDIICESLLPYFRDNSHFTKEQSDSFVDNLVNQSDLPFMIMVINSLIEKVEVVDNQLNLQFKF